MKGLRIKKSIIFTVLTAVLLGFIAFVEKTESTKTFNGIEVIVKGISDVYFVEEQEVIARLNNEFPELRQGTFMSDIHLAKIEKKVEKHPFVKRAEAFRDLKGKILVKIDQHKPIARVARPMAADGYVSSEGKILPTSPVYTSRVLIIEGPGAEVILESKDLSESHQDLLDMITYISNHKFWGAQIASMEIDRKGNIWLHQQVGRQIIEFGKPVELEEKFKKVEILYNEILPEKGWNTYSKVNVKYKDQIICE
ncbi:cell division protein [Anditalea andensis]|uniref:Cell division protein n=1 Tax=Anditalea andensis TaxID=1048983 RepID=A0A074L3U2_9BACT|nr:cell division protein [Anditalea andensis]